jgi:hypothetical protein
MKYDPNIVAQYFFEVGLPMPVTEYQFAAAYMSNEGKDGKLRPRKWAFDFAFLDHKIALEVEGGIWIAGGHSRGSGVKKDMEKYNAAAVLGWRVLRVEPKNLCTNDTAQLVHFCIYGFNN